MKTRKRVFVGMSGGVDSSVAAALLKEQGYDVVGVFMKNWSDDRFSDCPWEKDWQDVQAVGKKLGIPVMSWNFEREYRTKVIDYFFAEYAAGRTPNPDIMCNKEIKFGLFLNRSLAEGADYVVTGHYARKITREQVDSVAGRRVREQFLAIPKDTHKDQTYFLYTLTDDQLKRILFPLAKLNKEEVRAEARELGLSTADRPDSQGICFVGEVNLVSFLKSRLPEKPGPIVTVDGHIIGQHQGVWFYTVGQRHGLGVGGGIPYYVVGKDLKTNTLVVAPGSDHPALYSTEICVENFVIRLPIRAARVSVRIRHGGPLAPASLQLCDDSIAHISFDEPQRAVTPGQATVFYQDGVVVGGGTVADIRSWPSPRMDRKRKEFESTRIRTR